MSTLVLLLPLPLPLRLSICDPAAVEALDKLEFAHSLILTLWLVRLLSASSFATQTPLHTPTHPSLISSRTIEYCISSHLDLLCSLSVSRLKCGSMWSVSLALTKLVLDRILRGVVRPIPSAGWRLRTLSLMMASRLQEASRINEPYPTRPRNRTSARGVVHYIRPQHMASAAHGICRLANQCWLVGGSRCLPRADGSCKVNNKYKRASLFFEEKRFNSS